MNPGPWDLKSTTLPLRHGVTLMTMETFLLFEFLCKTGLPGKFRGKPGEILIKTKYISLLVILHHIGPVYVLKKYLNKIPLSGPVCALWDHLGPICGPSSERDFNHSSVYTLTNWSSRVPLRQKIMQTGPSVGPKYISIYFGTMSEPFGPNLWAQFRKGL